MVVVLVLLSYGVPPATAVRIDSDPTFLIEDSNESSAAFMIGVRRGRHDA